MLDDARPGTRAVTPSGERALWQVRVEVFSSAFSFFEVWERIPQLAARHPLELWSHSWRLVPDGIYATATVHVRAADEDAARACAAAMVDDLLAAPAIARRRPARARRRRQACT